MANYKTCAVPICKSTTIKCPNKLFITVPKCPKRRKLWLQLARRDPKFLSDKSLIFFCEDHFDLPNDMENYIQYKIMGSVGKIRMKPDSLPSKFECQPDKIKSTASPQPRSAVSKRRRMDILRDIISKKTDTPATSGMTCNNFRPTAEKDECFAKLQNQTTHVCPEATFVQQASPSAMDRLYLAKGVDGEIYIDCKLPQHQIDGLRFLYRQFKKRNPGVILNDPPGYGKRVQTVLFLNALIGTLSKPVLILCQNDCQRWQERFQEWTDLSDQVVVYHEVNTKILNPFVSNMKVCIMPIMNAAVLSARRAWSVLVVDDETVRPGIVGAQSVSNVDFKIFITTLDMKENLDVLFSILNFLHPKDKSNVAELIKKEKGVSKSIIIDAFLQDIVLRRNDFLTRFIEAEKNNKCIEPKRVTRKNKDASGTKIKRSKRKSEDNHTLQNNNTDINLRTNENYIKSPITSETYKEIEPSDNEMDIETFIRNTKPIGFENYEKYIDNTSESGVDDITEPEKSGIKTPVASDTSNSGSVRLFEDSRIENTWKRRLTNDFDLLKDIEDSVDDGNNKNKDGKNVIDCDTSNGLSLVAKIYENKVHDDDLSDEIEDELVGVIYNNDILRNINTIAVDCEVSNKETVSIKLVDDSVNGKPKDLIHDIGTTDIKENENVSVAKITTDATEIDVEAKCQKTIDEQIFEIEQTALEKFKGSLLDSIF